MQVTSRYEIIVYNYRLLYFDIKELAWATPKYKGGLISSGWTMSRGLSIRTHIRAEQSKIKTGWGLRVIDK